MIGVDEQKHSLSDLADAKAVVVVFTCNHCPVARAYEDRLVQLAADYGEKGVEIVAINVNNNDSDKLPKMKERADAGMNPDDVRVAPMAPNSMLAAFQSKQIDGFAMSLPWPLKPVQDGQALLIASGPDGDPGDMVPFGHNLIVTRQDTCVQRSALCVAVGRSIADATAYIKNQAGRGVRALEEALSDARRQAARGGLRGIAEGHAVTADPDEGRDRKRRDIQHRSRPAQAGREAEVLRRIVHGRICEVRSGALASLVPMESAPPPFVPTKVGTQCCMF